MRKALFAGSFDPFTLGHESIVSRALDIADEVVIGIGINAGKKSMFSVEQRIEMINTLYNNEPRVSVVAYNGLTTDFAESIEASFLVRGVRSSTDFEFEKNIADVNRKLTGLETVLFITENIYSCISSSIVRELLSYGKDVSDFLPEGINIKDVR
ncbi:MAG: pantetheine-phosphate adenylyltransferase [Bacteroides sp.]|nr:pantetheine-phosphate adenylyltransferase [Roseburia sp.]MCM1346869.1 pantetheine-phosphate adenylyltransferase [Bacteroides sp.]MCM1421412.1 pantetheine-phosphate adenylyltransferase [Bacteroides sp.]